MDSINSRPNVPIARVDSGETDDSPFCSNLVTPTDDQTVPIIIRPHLRDGIEEKFLLAKDSADYFTSGLGGAVIGNDLEGDIEFDTTLLEAPGKLEMREPPLVEELVRVSETLSQTPLISEDGNISNISTLDSNQTFPSSHPSLADVVARARRSSSVLYNFPNSHISINHKVSDSELSDEEVWQPTPDLLFTVSWPEDCQAVLSNLTIHAIFSLACRIVFFLPWCIAVGAAIILSPTNLSSIAFAPSVNYISHPSTPIELFAHWAVYGLQHITIFAGFVFTILWYFPDAGTVLLGALFAQFCWAWHDFLPELTTALGEDERQMIYYLVRSTWLTGNTVGIKKMNGKYYATDAVDDKLEVDSGSDLQEDSVKDL